MTILPKFQLVIPEEIRGLMDLISGQKIPMHFSVTAIDAEAEQDGGFELLGSINYFSKKLI